jgi:hypothetical protein
MDSEFDLFTLHSELAPLAERVLRFMFLDVAQNGLSPREIFCWKKDACWFPLLRDHPDVTALRKALPSALRTGIPCEPQLLWSLPETYEGQLWTHVDQEPPWANGRKYTRIVGVALTPWTPENGSPELHLPGGRVVVPTLDVGDVLVMRPDLPHTRGINRSGHLRAAAYFRFLGNPLTT